MCRSVQFLLIAELLALDSGARRGVRPGGVPSAEVHRRGDWPQHGAVSSRPQLFLLFILFILQEELRASVQDLPGVRLGAVQVLQQLQGGALCY